ncbi:HNH endonuclease [Paenibacillus endoradicis]|uniref:HNH endonuclease n=1 Tax=Paenibacillus endoradicis TaxID=2972487 RepID=UPI0021591995|nr:HNH endonuclease [Paenibacillus endoradicis]MCR8659184.1 HNH endonuclease [Paenibacillus endoradicis]
MNDLKVSIPTSQRWTACFYCEGHLPAGSKEHIFNSNWTGKHKTGSLICDDCNAAFGLEVDKAFLPYTIFPMNVWSLRGERHKEPPTINTDDNLVLRPGAKPEETPSFSSYVEDGKLYFSGTAPNKASLRRLLNEQLPKKLDRNLREDEINQLNYDIRQVKIHTKPAGSVKLQASIDPLLETRSTIHTILKCMALYDTNFKKSVSEVVLNFSRYGIGDWNFFAVLTHNIVIDVCAAYSKQTLDYNAVEVHYLPKSKQIIARLVILGQINRWIILSNEYEGPYQLLFVAEPSLGGKLETLLWTLSDTLPPSVQVDRAMVFDDFAKDLVKLSQNMLGLNAQIAQLLRGMKQIFKGHSHLKKELLEEYKDELHSFITNIIKTHSQITGYLISKSEQDILIDLMNNAIIELEDSIGLAISSLEIVKHIALPAQLIIDQLIQFDEQAKVMRKSL